ncbi:unnamed protein product [Polarella glacialis]|uniref:Uncharacterized protein n=2 Tax=Polarella glacialis TaxID=89957 RepID=A0A813LA07_POLGL|nr:unnamed protein product [Polarella glacialis]
MSDKFQKLLGDLTVQYMMDVQELRDEVIKLKSESECLKETKESSEPQRQQQQQQRQQQQQQHQQQQQRQQQHESSEPAVQHSAVLVVPAQQPIYQQQTQQEEEEEQQLQQPQQQQQRQSKSTTTTTATTATTAGHQSYTGMSKEDIKLARLDRSLQQVFEDDGENLAAEVHHCTCIANFLQSDAYELMVGFIILMNVFVMAAVLQVQGTGLGYSLGYPGYSEPSRGWQEASEAFTGLDLPFLGLYTVDIILRTSVLHVHFFQRSFELGGSASSDSWLDRNIWKQVHGSLFLANAATREVRPGLPSNAAVQSLALAADDGQVHHGKHGCALLVIVPALSHPVHRRNDA